MAATPPEDTTGLEQLEIDIDEQDELITAGYHCVDCGNPVTYHQTRCNKCGAALNWEGI